MRAKTIQMSGMSSGFGISSNASRIASFFSKSQESSVFCLKLQVLHREDSLERIV